MKHYLQSAKSRDLARQELIQRILNDEQTLAATRAKLDAERAAESAVQAPEVAANASTALPVVPAPVENPKQNQPSHPITSSHISKETQEMSSTPVAHAKAALRAKASNDNSTSEYVSLPVHSASNASSDTPHLDHHSRKCQVCRHPHRETIEELFVNWHSPRDISEEFDGNPRLDWTSIYRHARATGLSAKRSRNLRAVFDLVLENASSVTPTAQGIVAVVRAYTALTENNTWIEPERRVHITNHVFRHDVPAPSSEISARNLEPQDAQDDSSTFAAQMSAAQPSSSESGLPAAAASVSLCDSPVAQATEVSQTSSAPSPSTQHSSTTGAGANVPFSNRQDSSLDAPACPPQRSVSPGRPPKPNRNSPELKFPLTHT